jgi:hypothetical protein
MAVSNEMKDIGCALALMLFLGVLLLILRKPLAEGFYNSGAARCGVDMAPCSGSLKCVNGFCADTQPKAAYEKKPVPLVPKGFTLPFY